jgi:hypothetical protein
MLWTFVVLCQQQALDTAHLFVEEACDYWRSISYGAGSHVKCSMRIDVCYHRIAVAAHAASMQHCAENGPQPLVTSAQQSGITDGLPGCFLR